MSYRIRIEGELLVLQVQEPNNYSPYDNPRDLMVPKWRDAKVTDIPLGQIFPSPLPEGHVLISKETARSFGMGDPL